MNRSSSFSTVLTKVSKTYFIVSHKNNKRRPMENKKSYKNLTKAQDKFDQTDGLWQTVSKWNEKSDGWMNDPFSTVNAEALNTEVQGFVKDAFSAHKKVRNHVPGTKAFFSSNKVCSVSGVSGGETELGGRLREREGRGAGEGVRGRLDGRFAQHRERGGA